MPKHSIISMLSGRMHHLLMWSKGKRDDIVYHNPKFMPSSPDDSGTTIYCIHGTADRNAAFETIVSNLIDSLPVSVSTIHLMSFDERFHGVSIEVFAEQLTQRILENNHQQVILIGHSRGGIIAAYFTEYLAQLANIQVNGVISICGPFGGSVMAMPPLTWVSSSIKEMTLNNEFLIPIQERVSVSPIPYFFFGAKYDVAVRHDDNCPRARLDELIMLDSNDHLSIMARSEMADLIRIQIAMIVAEAKHCDADCLDFDADRSPASAAYFRSLV